MVQTVLQVCISCMLVYLLFWFLYQRGLISLDLRQAVIFVGAHHGKQARFTACTGHSRRRIRFAESRPYAFTLDASLTAGTFTAELLDASGRPLLLLSADQSTGTVDAHADECYTLILRFKSASGSYTLNWA